MDLRNCRKCNKLFSYTSKPICPECEKADENDFEKVRAFLKENPGATVPNVSEETGVSSASILRYLKSGRIEVSEGSQALLKCEKCNKPIFVGRYCRDCSNRMSKSFANAAPSMPSIPLPSQDSNKKATLSMSLSKEKSTR